tara:strand:- start:86 stop:427 length:342 start_codon:yes stop_codon:yes gene_type:complete
LKKLREYIFFVKDKDFHLIFAIPYFYRRLGLQSQQELLRKDDFQLFPEPLAKKFRKDDESFMKEKLPMAAITVAECSFIVSSFFIRMLLKSFSVFTSLIAVESRNKESSLLYK